MFWSKMCKSNWNCAWNLAFLVFISPVVWNMCENLHYESVYFKEVHNEEEYFWSTIYSAGAAVVSTYRQGRHASCFWLFSPRSRVGDALRPIFMLWLVKIWLVSSCGKFMQHLETCLLCWRQSFVSTCNVFNCLFPLNVQNEIQLLIYRFSQG